MQARLVGWVHRREQIHRLRGIDSGLQIGGNQWSESGRAPVESESVAIMFARGIENQFIVKESLAERNTELVNLVQFGGAEPAFDQKIHLWKSIGGSKQVSDSVGWDKFSFASDTGYRPSNLLRRIR